MSLTFVMIGNHHGGSGCYKCSCLLPFASQLRLYSIYSSSMIDILIYY
ncbi:unnamed protein product [Amoebophrya sp. A25]|nr:unnamed protein product [Amoebophrya sp. A25]|eukprot:GSA25T00007638001.1